MAKTRVKNKTNAIVKNSQKELAAKVNAALFQADMRYGNGDQFIRDGVFKAGAGYDINDWPHAREELGL